MFLCLLDCFSSADGSNGQQGTTGKRKASVPLTDYPERKRTKVFHHKGIPYLQVWFLLRARLIMDRYMTILSDRTWRNESHKKRGTYRDNNYSFVAIIIVENILL